MDEQPIKVLLFEDDESFANIVTTRLTAETSEKFELENVASLAEGIERLCQHKVDVILLDLNLPDGQGVENDEKIRLYAPLVPIVIFTGMDDEDMAIRALQKGAEDYVVKGSVPAKLLTRIILYAIERNRIKRDLDYAKKQLEQMVLIDPLTEILNRRGLQEALSRETMMLRRYGTSLISMLIDLDNFKMINDSLGHNVGDIILKEVARVIKEKLRFTDHISRIGGDEFLALMPNTRLGEGLRVAERLRLAISSAVISVDSGKRVTVTASMGVIQIGDADFTIDQLLAQTHHMLKKSKQTGKDSITYSDGHYAIQLEKDKKLSEFVEVVSKGMAFHALKHPIFYLRNEALAGYEFLSRLQFPTFEMPDDFFRLAREAKILTLVDHQCFRSCIRAGSDLPKDIVSYINLLPSTLIDIAPEKLLEEFPKNRPMKNYCIEISEKQVIGNPSYLIEPIKTLKKAGLSIALDDVGFGQSCLESLVILEPDIMKIDRSWINGITQDKFKLKQVERLLKIADSLGLEVVAEGIETRENLETLKTMNVKFGQGFLWGKPA